MLSETLRGKGDMLGRLLVIDGDVTSRFTMKARLTAANHKVLTANSVAEACMHCDTVNAVLLRNPDARALAHDVALLRPKAAVPVIAICDSSQRSAAFRAGVDHVLDPHCSDLVLRARLRSWLAQPAESNPGFAEPSSGFDYPDQIALVTDEATLSSEWRQAIAEATGRPLHIVSSQAAFGKIAANFAVVLVDGGQQGEGMQHLADLRARLAADGRGTALALLQRKPLPEQEAQALDFGAIEVLPTRLSALERRGELTARLNWLLRRGIEAEQRQSDARLARQLATLDPLTGLANRRRISADIAAAAKSGDGYSVLMIDIDRFKSINDTYGHAAGDAVLVSVAATLAGLVEGRGKVARYGGEEFLALLPHAEETMAVSLAERIRYELAALPVQARGLTGMVELKVSVSIGVAVSENRYGVRQSTDLVLRQADAALLAAKAAGRDLVMLSREPHAA
ncbi:diguanylate cyclase [Paracoccus xiamenensis]|uniref:diguanylate cyclase n=1 Tax=Paracoccus xiamenensis TaxID=2714901 RepID=UPI001408F4BA|nr:diguanylate cyclase [Paracoccus xiamenensis]NHF72183.1 diguanylate cyclase [Paracoccus xiamenensis]